MSKTLSFDEKNNGWTSFWSYKPEWMSRLGNNFYSFKNGQLFRHHSETAEKNLFYNESGQLLLPSSSSVTFVFNQEPSDVKHFKTISLEASDNLWNVEMSSSLDRGHITYDQFSTREGEHYAFIRRNDGDLLDFHHISVQGLGTPTSITGDTYAFTQVPSFLSEEDCLYFSRSIDSVVIKVGKLISFDSTTVTTATPIIGTVIDSEGFYFVAKNSEAESYGIKGYVLEVKLTSTGNGNAQDLYSVNAEVFKSYQ
jgi:hypothetical protein